MQKPVFTLTVLFILCARFSYGQFGLTPEQWPTPVGGLNYQDSGSAKTFGFNFDNESAYQPEYGGQSWQLIDMNGDKKPDLVVMSYVDSSNQKTLTQFNATNNPYWKVYLSNGTSFSTTATQWATPQGGYASVINHDTIVQGFFSNANDYASGSIGSQDWILQDMNGDGKPDLVVTGAVSSSNSGKSTEFGASTNSPYWMVYLNTGTGFAASATQWPTPVGGSNGELSGVETTRGYWCFTASDYIIGAQQYNLQDIDGDGKPDLVITSVMDSANHYTYTQYGANTNSPYWMVYLNNGTGFASTATQWPTPVGGSNYNAQGLQTTDGFNLVNGGISGDAYGAQNWQLTDINGDGKPDLIITAVIDSINHGFATQLTNGNTQYWNVFLNTGSGFATSGVNWVTPAAQGFKYVLLGTTHTFGLVSLAYDFAYSNPGEQTWKTIDMNNDGKPDLVFLGTVDSMGHLAQNNANTQPYWQVYFNNGTSFADTAARWYTSKGGLNFDTSGVATNYGFNSNIGRLPNGKYYNAQSWDVVDMDGDGKPDLVVTAAIDSANQSTATEFNASTNPYWIVYINGKKDTVPTDTTTGILPVTSTSAGCVIYPNPNNGTFIMQFSTTAERTVSIYDVTGRMVGTPVTMQNQQQFNLGSISAGIYIVRMTQDGNTSSLKFAVE